MNQYPASNFHDLNLDWLLQQMKNCLAEWNETKTDWENLEADNTEFKTFVTNYLQNLDVSDEISAKIDALVEDGTILELLTEDTGDGSPLSDVVGAWMYEYITTSPDGFVTNKTLTVENAAADAKATGDAIADLKGAIGNAMQLENCTGYASYPYNFVSGKKYTLAVLDGKVRASTRATETGAEIDIIFSTITDAPAVKTFIASANASYLRVSVEVANPPATVCVFENTSVNGILSDLELKTKEDLADFSESPTTINATGYDNYAYNIKAGKSYTFRVIEGSCRAYTRATAEGENIDTIIGTSKQAPYFVTFTATADASYVRVLADTPSKVSIVNASSIYDAIDDLDAELNAEIDKLSADIDNIESDLYSKQSFETSGITYDSFPCQITAGKEYVVVLNQGSMRLSTRATADGANIDDIITSSKAAPYYAKFTASSNASYFRVLADNAVQFDVYDTAVIIGLIEKLNYINFSKTELGLDINAPYPQKPADSSSDADFNAETVTSTQIYSYLDNLTSNYPQVLTKEYLGKDSTNTYDINRYIFCDSQRSSYYATIFIGANEHGPSSDPRECAIICCRFLNDLCQAHAKTNPYLNFLKKYFKFVIIPIVNPYGFDTEHRNNGNDVNINRNYNTPGWSSVQDSDKGVSAGSEVETQYVMNTITAYNPQVALDVHCHGYVNPLADKLMLINAANLVTNRQGLTDVTKLMKRDYDITCDVAYTQAANSSEGQAYYDYVGIHGALIELLAREGTTAENLIHTATILEADYTFMLRVIDALITDYNPLYSFDQKIF